MDISSITIDPETGIPVVGIQNETSGSDGLHVPLGKKELDSLSIFEDFVESLDMKGIGFEQNAEDDKLEPSSEQ